MELLDVSLDRLYKRVYNHLHERITEPLIGHIAVCVRFLDELVEFRNLDNYCFGLSQDAAANHSQR